MSRNNDWEPLSWYCSNCGHLVTGYKNANGDIKVECKICHIVMVRKIKSRKHDTIDLYASKNSEHDFYGTTY